MNMEIEPFLLASSISGVLGLRLIRTTCKFCAEPYEPEPALMRLVPVEDRETATFRRGAGCDQCKGTGFGGRIAVVELLTVSQPFREAVMQKLPTKELQQVAVNRGMLTLWQRGLRRVYSGQTTLEEILRVISVDEL
jgi:type IV pilus assembly protein PilB